MSYAEGTTVPVEQSRAELERMLSKRGALDFMAGEVGGRAQVVFRLSDRHIRFAVPLQQRAPRRRLPEAQMRTFHDRERRRLWRALILSVKARFEAVDSGIETFEEAFLAHVVVQGGKTIGELAIPTIDSGASSVAGLLGAGT